MMKSINFELLRSKWPQLAGLAGFPRELADLLVVTSISVWRQAGRSASWDRTYLQLQRNDGITECRWTLQWKPHESASDLFARYGHLLLSPARIAAIERLRSRERFDADESEPMCVVCGDPSQIECDPCGAHLCADHPNCTECER